MPPDGVITTLPLLPPLQLTFVLVNVAPSGEGAVIVALITVVHAFASVTVKVYVPAERPVCVGLMLYGAVPPAGEMITLPLLSPAQLTLFCVKVADSAAGAFMVVLELSAVP